MRKLIVVDFETVNQHINLKTHGAWRYIHDEHFFPLCAAFKWLDGEELWIPGEEMPISVARLLKDGATLMAFNVFFDRTVWEHIGWGVYPWLDLQAWCGYLGLPKSVESCAQVLLGEGKDLEGNILVRKIQKEGFEITEDIYEAILSYCQKDVDVEWRIMEMISNKPMPPREEEIYNLTEEMNYRGIYTDRKLARCAIEVIKAIRSWMVKQCWESGGYGLQVKDFTSPQRFKEVLSGVGVDAVNVKKDYLAKLPRDDPRVSMLLDTRIVAGSNINRKFDILRNRTSVDDPILRVSFKYYCAHTWRWSSVGMQLQNMPRISSRDELVNTARLTGNGGYSKIMNHYDWDGKQAYTRIKDMIRACLRSRPGHVLIVADYSAIEARMSAWLSGDTTTLNKYRRGEDLYCDMASIIFGKEVTKTDKIKRQVGKICVLAMGYGMGPDRLKIEHGELLEAADISPDHVVTEFRNEYHMLSDYIRGLWQRYDRAFRTALNIQGLIIDGKCTFEWGYTQFGKEDFPFIQVLLPSGRDLFYWQPWISDTDELLYHPLDKTQHLVKTESVRVLDSKLYGGKLLENICQAVCRDILAEHMLILNECGVRLLGTVHDEVIVEVEKDEAGKLAPFMEEVMTTPPEWCSSLPLSVEVSVDERYTK